MKVEQVLSLPEGLEVTNIDVIDGVLTISAVSTQTSVCCPLCSSMATRVHSHYRRTIADLPCAGQPVRLLVQVRKFFCDVKACARKIFVERLAPFVEPLARVTTRLSESVQVIGFATGGMLGARLTDRLGIQTCWMTILRRMMAMPTAPVERVVELGIDDFAFRRGRKFGSILVDMQSHKVIDLLPDRKAETAATWMGAHPEIELVSRDRGGDYAAGARQGAPQAKQIADRFHLYKNLIEAVELILARCRAQIRKNAQLAIQQEPHEEAPKPLLFEHAEVICVQNWKPEPELCDERACLSRREQRYDRYQQVMALYEQGLGFTEIARRVGLSRRTVERWVKEGGFPETKRRRKRRSIFDPYAHDVLSRWEQGCTNGLQLWQEIQAQGYQGSAQTIYRFLRSLRKKRRVICKPEVPQAPLQDFCAHEAVWLFARDPASLDEKEQETLTAICQASERARTTSQLVQEFRHMLHHRAGEKLETWLAKCTASQIREFQSFVQGVERDKAAVVAGLTLAQNNGLVEGKVNKLKLIKRMGYGRAGFALLRQRVLHAL
jgi:excisionase family DNA binding protein